MVWCKCDTYLCKIQKTRCLELAKAVSVYKSVLSLKKTLQTKSVFHIHKRSHTYSKCSMKLGNLRDLTRWLELPGNPPIGTFLPVYGLLHTHTHSRRPNIKITVFHIHGLNLNHGHTHTHKKKSRECTLTSSAFSFNFWTQFGCSKHKRHTCSLLRSSTQSYDNKSCINTHSLTQWWLLWALNLQVLLSSAGRIVTFQFLLPNISGQFGIGPLGPFSKHILCYHLLPISFLNFSGRNVDVKVIWWTTLDVFGLGLEGISSSACGDWMMKEKVGIKHLYIQVFLSFELKTDHRIVSFLSTAKKFWNTKAM